MRRHMLAQIPRLLKEMHRKWHYEPKRICLPSFFDPRAAYEVQLYNGDVWIQETANRWQLHPWVLLRASETFGSFKQRRETRVHRGYGPHGRAKEDRKTEEHFRNMPWFRQVHYPQVYSRVIEALPNINWPSFLQNFRKLVHGKIAEDDRGLHRQRQECWFWWDSYEENVLRVDNDHQVHRGPQERGWASHWWECNLIRKSVASQEARKLFEAQDYKSFL